MLVTQPHPDEERSIARYICSPTHIAALERRHHQAVENLHHAKAHKVSTEQDAYIHALATEVVGLAMQLEAARRGRR